MNNLILRVEYSQNDDTSIKCEKLYANEKKGDIYLQVDKQDGQYIFNLFFNKGVSLHKLYIDLAYEYPKEARIYCNGFQSWSVTREYSINEASLNLKKLGHLINKAYAVDRYNGQDQIKALGKKGTFLSHTYTYIKESPLTKEVFLLGSLSERSGFTAFYHDANKNLLTIEKECKGLSNVDKYYFCLYMGKGQLDQEIDRYLDGCLEHKKGSFARTKFLSDKERKYSGFTSWYNFYQDISERIIERNIFYYFEANRKADIFQIDDGYQTYVGDWLDVDEKKFPKGMKSIAHKIKNKNSIPGLWFAPFTCERDSRIFSEKPNWVIRDQKNRPYKAGSGWSGFYGLNSDDREVKNYLEHVVDVFSNEWGFEFLKLDFLYNACLLAHSNKTRGQLMCEAMDFINVLCKDLILLGCGVPLGPAFWNVDFCRIGADISLDWDNKLYMRLLVRERVSTRNSLTNTVFRSHLDKKVFVNDPDVFMLRDENCEMSKDEKEILGHLNSAYASLLFTSDEVDKYKPWQSEMFLKIISGMDKAKTEYLDDKSNLIIDFEDKTYKIPLKDHKKPEIILKK